MYELKDKVCVITGGAGSLGFVSARHFVAAGARVMLVDRDETALKRCVEELGTEHAHYAVADVSIAEQVQRYLSITLEHFGKFDILFSNAGSAGAIAPLADYPEDVFDLVYQTHVKGAFLACKYGLSCMNDGGSVIITSSVAGLRGDPGVYAYITAKHAQVGLMRAVSKEAAARNIRVNTLHPGPINNAFQADIEQRLGQVLETDATAFFNQRIPLGRHAHPDEIAQAVLFLACNEYTTGSTLVIDGGMST
ncbi:SDR family NAD(P)-dependent oxidoreductase [Pseudomonas extremaustralis]|uniref:SDR family NAD(P)-dependent oxidoreductase n=1 Tax=Pseudomonas extremaustralis TaxID=359110 RepID=UPI00285FD47A|nr:SDR family NAD(P)-dependent oxidoreductase [Pseudomonas extremaustralis]MDR6575875.1 NAD(P)-dependent dehydrogenase (short-subunit alcohol dehydrogenase family) [Pseudomonas extremaustralis]